MAFQDEVHFQQATSITRKWARKGSAPTVNSPPGKHSIAYSGYVIPSTGQLFTDKPEWFRWDTVVESIRKFLAEIELPPGKRVYLVLDNAPWHKKAIRLIQTEALDEYQDIREQATLVAMPKYSPDLNPIEQCWRMTRREVTHNRYFATLADLISKLDAYFASHKVANKQFQALCSFECFQPI